jgi:acetyl-CoA carboxylase carboxyltransferase component
MIRKAYLKKVTESLESLMRDIEDLPGKSEHIGDALRKQADEQFKSLRALEKTARERVAELAEAGDAHWGRFKAGVDHAIGDLGKEVRKAAEKVKRTASGSR